MSRRWSGALSETWLGNTTKSLPKLPPSESGWILEWFSFTIVTDATVATRLPFLTWQKAPLVAVPFANAGNTVLTAGVTGVATWCDVGQNGGNLVGALVWCAGQVPIPGEAVVTFAVQNGQAGDAVGAVGGVVQPTTYCFREAE